MAATTIFNEWHVTVRFVDGNTVSRYVKALYQIGDALVSIRRDYPQYDEIKEIIIT